MPGVDVACRNYTWCYHTSRHYRLRWHYHSAKDTHVPSIAGKTTTTNIHIAELATAVDGGKGSKYIDGTPSQGLLVIPPMVDIDHRHINGRHRHIIHCYDSQDW